MVTCCRVILTLMLLLLIVLVIPCIGCGHKYSPSVNTEITTDVSSIEYYENCGDDRGLTIIVASSGQRYVMDTREYWGFDKPVFEVGETYTLYLDYTGTAFSNAPYIFIKAKKVKSRG